MAFSITPNVQVETDISGVVQHLQHPQEPYLAGPGVGSEAELATIYLRDVAEVYGIDRAMLPDIGEEPSEGPGPFLVLAEQKQTMGTAIVSFAETYTGLPIWEAGFTVAIQANPLRVTASWSTVHREVDLDEPSELGPGLTPEEAGPERAAELLGLKRERPGGRTTRRARDEARLVRVNDSRALIYRYDPDRRIDPESRIEDDRPLSSGPPTLPLPTVPERIQAGRHYLVTEVLFTLALPVWGEVHWRAFFERYTGAVLYLRAFVASADGLVFRADPVTLAGGPLPNGPLAQLDALRSLTALADLQAQAGGVPVALNGRFVQLADFAAPPAAPPTEPFGHFLYNANTTNFSAVNAYHHLDSFFQLMQSMGFVVADYFDETSFNPGFPVPVDHWAVGGGVNAFSLGNSTGTGSGGFIFGAAAVGTNVGIADDARVVAHEFCHALLWDSVHSPNFGFAHSAGDSIGAILNDPGSQAPDRFVTFPWVTIIGRRHDRPVAGGWAWGGVNDTGGYNSEQILCTSHFRAYRSTGGDSSGLAMQQHAGRYIVYLIIRGIGSLATAPITPTPNPAVWVTALQNADIGTAIFDDQPGGCCVKVLRWAFEQQGLFQPPGAPVPVVTPGAPPSVDVYIDDGRAGQYAYAERFWHTTEVWNRHAPDGGTAHQTPIVGELNYTYVRVRNRGTQPASGVVVRGHHCRPAVGLVWPDDWTPMTTAAVTLPGSIAPGGQIIVGPLEWTPQVAGHECLLMSVSAPGDLANNDPATFFPCASGPSPIWRLVPFDNNLAQRAVIPVPGGGGRHNLVEAFEHRRFWAQNPFPRTARIEIQAELPAFLQTRGWQVTWDGPGTSPFSLGPRDEIELRPRLIGGQDFTPTEVTLAGEVAIDIVERADGLVVGGLTFLLDPELCRPPHEHKCGHGHGHEHSHDCGHEHECGHEHGDGHDCGHEHKCGHGHGHDCGHGQGHDCRHEHGHRHDCGHEHGHDCGHDCRHEHGHKCGHGCGHGHGHGCGHEHGHGCEHGHDCGHGHGHDCGHGHGCGHGYDCGHGHDRKKASERGDEPQRKDEEGEGEQEERERTRQF